jgi:hypothetical protein
MTGRAATVSVLMTATVAGGQSPNGIPEARAGRAPVPDASARESSLSRGRFS